MNNFFTTLYNDSISDILLENNNLTYVFLDNIVNRINKTVSSNLPSNSKSKELFKIKKDLYKQLKQEKYKNIDNVRNLSELDIKIHDIIKDLSEIKDRRYKSLIYLDRFYRGIGKK